MASVPYATPNVIDLGEVTKLTEGIRDLLTDNHNGTWQRIPGVRKAAAKRASGAKKAKKKTAKKSAPRKGAKKKTAARKKR